MRKFRIDNIVAIKRIAATNILRVSLESKHLVGNHCTHTPFDKNERNPCILCITLYCNSLYKFFSYPNTIGINY